MELGLLAYSQHPAAVKRGNSINQMSVSLWLRGGLGNQLFQYAFGRQVSATTQKPLEIRTALLPSKPDLYRGSGRWPQQISDFQHSGTLRIERGQPEGATNFISKSHTSLGYFMDLFPQALAQAGFLGGQEEKDWGSLLRRASKRESIVLDGYFIDKTVPIAQREALVREIFTTAEQRPSQSPGGLKESRIPQPGLAVHVRLGDNLLQQPNLLTDYENFYEVAIRLATKEMGRLDIFVYSDQPDIAKRLISKVARGRNVVVATPASPIQTLRLMGSHIGLVAAPSTFSWWGGFLQGNQACVYMGSPWPNDRRAKGRRIYPDEWKLVQRNH